MTYTYNNKGTCSVRTVVELNDDHTIKSVQILGGCDGNLKGIANLLPGMNATAEIEVSSAENALTIPNGAVVRGNYVLVTKDSPSAVNAVQDMTAPDGYVYVKITTGTSDNDSIEVTGGLQEGDTIAYDADAAEKQNASGSGGHGGGNGGPGGRGPGGGF